jgi:hypothetical protein
MKKYMLAAAVLASLASPAMAEPVMIDLGPAMTCYINDNDPPSNIRTQPNGVVVGHLYNGTVVVPARSHESKLRVLRNVGFCSND